jgi:TP901 family phage tail tape measure protein
MTERDLRFQFGMDGERDVRRALDDMGRAGSEAFETIRRAAERVGGPALSRFVTNVRRSVQNVQQVSRDLGQRFGDLDRAVSVSARRFTVLAAAVTGAATAVGLFVRSSAQAADEIGKTAQELGLTVEGYQRLNVAVQQATRLTEQQFGMAMARLNTAISEAAEGANRGAEAVSGFGERVRRGVGGMLTSLDESGVRVRRMNEEFGRTTSESRDAGNALQRLGIEVRDANGELRSTEDILGDLADQFTRMEDGPEKSALAVQFFGQRAGPLLIPLLNEGRDAIARYSRQLDELGGPLSEAETRIGTNLVDAFGLLRIALDLTRTRLGLIFAPTVQSAVDAFRQGVANNATALQDLARQIEARVTPVVEDLIALLSGRADDVSDPRILEWRDAIVGFASDVQSAVTGIIVPAFRALVSAAESVSTAINRVFGTEFSGTQILIAAAVARFLGLFRVLGAAIGVLTTSFRLLIAVMGATGFLGALRMLAPVLRLVIAPLLIAAAALAAFSSDARAAFDAVLDAGQRAMRRLTGETDRAMDSMGESASTMKRVFAPSVEEAMRDAERSVSGADLSGAADGLLGDVENAFADADFSSEAREAWDRVKRAFETESEDITFVDVFIENVRGALRKLGEVVARGIFTTGITPAFADESPFAGMSEGVERDIHAVEARTDEMVARLADMFRRVRDRFAETAAELPGLWEAAIDRIEEASGRIVDSVVATLSASTGGVEEVWSELIDRLSSGLAGAVEALAAGFSSLTSTVTSSVDSMIADINRLIARVEAAIAALRRLQSARASSGGSGGGSSQGFATGGHFRGEGTSKSDSNVIRVSDGEYIVRTDAVRHYGVAFFDALNQMRLAKDRIASTFGGDMSATLGAATRSIRRSLDGLRQFNTGGLVEAMNQSFQPLAVPAFQGAAPADVSTSARSGRPFILQLPDGRQIEAGTIRQSAVSELADHAARVSMSSGGRLPGHYRG